MLTKECNKIGNNEVYLCFIYNISKMLYYTFANGSSHPLILAKQKCIALTLMNLQRDSNSQPLSS